VILSSSTSDASAGIASQDATISLRMFGIMDSKKSAHAVDLPMTLTQPPAVRHP
jgi:hypothetical protein